MDIRSIQSINTPENIPLHVELAGIAARFFAFLIDLALIGILLGIVMGLLLIGQMVHLSPEIIKIIVPLTMLALPFSYHFLQEWLWNGKSIGKALLRIRVVRVNGQPIGAWESFGRNLLRLVDVYLSGIGLVCMMLNQGEKRFGDFVAGTMVIMEHPTSYALKRAERDEGSPALSTEEGVFPDEVHLSPEEKELFIAYARRRADLSNEGRRQRDEEFQAYFSGVFPAPFQLERLLEEVLPDNPVKTR